MPGACAVCTKPSLLMCSGCKLIHYCSKDHQKMHWKQAHKTQCRTTYRLEKNEKLGRFLTAARNIAKGEVIFQEIPLVVGPKSVTFPLCLGCHSLCDPNDYHECDGCGFPLCSAKCQVSDYHMEECRVMMEAKFRVTIDMSQNKKEIYYFPIVPLRCLLLRNTNPEKYKRLLNLQSHLEERIKTPLFDVYRKNVVEFIRDRLGRKDFSETDILNILGILDTNAFEVRNKKSKFRGLYNTASMLSHNCKPNTKHVFLQPEMTMVLVATTDIPQGEIISATYTQTFWDTQSRRQHLKSIKCFDCDCERCSDPTELGTFAGAIRCLRCITPDNFQNGPYIVPVEPLKWNTVWRCQECAHEITAKQIKSGNDNIREELSRPEMKTVQGLEGFLDKYGVYSAGVLHPRNFNVVQVKHALIQIIGNTKDYTYSELSDDLLERKIEYCHELLDMVDVLDPGFSRIRGEILNELQSAIVMQTKRQFQRGKITKEAAQKNLSDAIVILKEVIEILRMDMDVEEFEGRIQTLLRDLDE